MGPALYTCAHTPLNILRLGSLLTPMLYDPGGHSLESWGEGTHRGSGLESGAFGCPAGAALESVVLVFFVRPYLVLFCFWVPRLLSTLALGLCSLPARQLPLSGWLGVGGWGQGEAMFGVLSGPVIFRACGSQFSIPGNQLQGVWTEEG